MLTILDGMEREKIVEVIDFLTDDRYRAITVADVKKRFNLTNDEYEMIFELAMPAIRQNNSMRFYKQLSRKMTKEVEGILSFIFRFQNEDKKLLDKVITRLSSLSTMAEEAYRKRMLGEEDEEEEREMVG